MNDIFILFVLISCVVSAFGAITTTLFLIMIIRIRIKNHNKAREILMMPENFYLNHGMARANPDQRGLTGTRWLSDQYFDELS